MSNTNKDQVTIGRQQIVIGCLGLVIAACAILFGLLTPEIRRIAGLDNDGNRVVDPRSTMTVSNEHPPTNFFGKWRNVDSNTSSITRLQILSENNRLSVKIYGRCHPSDCDIEAAATQTRHYYDPESRTLHSTYVLNHADYEFAISRDAGGRMRVGMKTHFKDNSGRLDTESVDYFEIES